MTHVQQRAKPGARQYRPPPHSTPTAASRFSNYTHDNGAITFMHTEVPKALKGRGIGSTLVKGALDLARAQGVKVKARCPFVKAWIERHPDYADLQA